jgi:hypothetical protein
MSQQPESPAVSVKKQQEAQRQLVLDYKAVFGSDKGKRVLAHLKATVGFDRCEADSELLTDNQIARRVCMKRLIYDIERKLKTTFRERDNKPTRARNHHEPTTDISHPGDSS